MRKILVLFISIIIVSMFTACSKQQAESEDNLIMSSSSTEALVPYSAADCEGKDQAVLKSDFLAAGFANIATEIIEDLKFNETDKVGSVISVSINGQTDFTQGQKFDNIANVIIGTMSRKSTS